MDKNIVPIVFAFDNNWVLPASVCISSLLINAKEDTFYDIFILYSGKEVLKKDELDRVSEYYSNCRIQYHIVGDCFSNAFEIRGITISTYYRLLIPDLIKEYDKVIYSDVDIIFRMDLVDLYKQEMQNYYLAATYDFGLNFSSGGQKYIASVKELVSGEYIQAGFIMMNSALMRETGLVEQFKSLAQKNFRFQDQDILNIACKGKIKKLPFNYNMTVDTFYYIEKYSIPVLERFADVDMDEARLNGNIHFNGAKPWKKYSVNFDVWWEYYRKSPIYDSEFYFDFFYSKLDEYDKLPFMARVKILLRYFFYKK